MNHRPYTGNVTFSRYFFCLGVCLFAQAILDSKIEGTWDLPGCVLGSISIALSLHFKVMSIGEDYSRRKEEKADHKTDSLVKSSYLIDKR